MQETKYRTNAVVITAVACGLGALMAIAAGVITATRGNFIALAVAAVLAFVAAGLAVGLWRGDRLAHTTAYVVFTLFALAGLARMAEGGAVMIAAGIALIVGLSLPGTRAYFGVR